MLNVDPNLRKAAVLLRSLDADTAALMLGQLSADEAAAIRSAMRELGAVELDEQADVAAELRGSRRAAGSSRASDVELSLSSDLASDSYQAAGLQDAGARSKRFEFLESAPAHVLVQYLAREHAQTIAVVLSHLAPRRAAAVLAELPAKLQADTMERLSAIGETDPECVSVLERELEAWFAKREGARANGGRRRDTMAAILAAADPDARGRIMNNVKLRNAAAAKPVATKQVERLTGPEKRTVVYTKVSRQPITPAPRTERPLPRVAFDDLVNLDARTLASVLRQVDANVLALALTGSHDELIDLICEQMPKRMARMFRRELRRIGPTRLSDVEAAQRAVAQVAAQLLSERRRASVSSAA
jgi:flagellar motor switch protein FliG